MEECRNISLDSLKQRPTIDELMEYYNVGTNWYLLGVQLKLDTKDLDAIDTQYKNVKMKLCKMYELWLRSTPDATKGQLLVALRKKSVDEQTVAANHCEKSTISINCNN